MNPPIITPPRPGTRMKPPVVSDSYGRRYALIPTGSRTYRFGGTKDLTAPQSVCLTFSYRRIDEQGKIMPRMRMSKKAKLQLRRQVKEGSN